MRRSTLGTIGRFAGILALIVTPTLLVHSFYLFAGFFAYKQHDDALPFAGRTFFEFGPDVVVGGVGTVFLYYICAVVALVVGYIVIWLFRLAIEWAVYEDEEVCQDPKCTCVMHGGVSYQRYLDDLNRDALLAAAIAT